MMKVTSVVMMLATLFVMMSVTFVPIMGVITSDDYGVAFKCPPAFFTFGDSLTDTGNVQTSFPSLGRLHPPYGSSYEFEDKPGLNRYSNGRLIIDYIAQAFDHPLYATYAHTLNGANYQRGANFAYAGATANATSPAMPFDLGVQLDNFFNFKSASLDSAGKGSLLLEPVVNAFAAGAYFIPSIGGNDLFIATSGLDLPSETVVETFAREAALAVENAILALHASGARLFIVGNIPAAGCNPAQLSQFDERPKDGLKCVLDVNANIEAYKGLLLEAVDRLHTTFGNDGTLLYHFDFYRASVVVLSEPEDFGFTNTHQSCCGVGGKYGYDSASTCGGLGSCCPGLAACATPGSYVHWDGIHYTQAFYRQMAKFLLDGMYVYPHLNLTSQCDLRFLSS